MTLDMIDELQRISRALIALEMMLSCTIRTGEPLEGAEQIVSLITEKVESLASSLKA